MSRFLVRLLACSPLVLSGCFDDFVQEPHILNKAIAVPALPEAAVANAARVDQIGRQLVGQNPFLGVEPTFHTYGRAEPEIIHPDLNGVLVTEGLVRKCVTDDELAAVLALELAKMSGERRAANRLKASRLPHMPDSGTLGLGSDPTQTGTQAMIDQASRSDRPRKDLVIEAAEILKAAGFDPKALEQVAPLMREAEQNHALEEHLRPRGLQPRWSK